MFDDFFTRALIAGIGIAIVTGPLGCLVIWRRLSYFGDTLAHSALLGVTLAYAFSINISLSVFIISGIVALLLLSLQKKNKISRRFSTWTISTFSTCYRTSAYWFSLFYSF